MGQVIGVLGLLAAAGIVLALTAISESLGRIAAALDHDHEDFLDPNSIRTSLESIAATLADLTYDDDDAADDADDKADHRGTPPAGPDDGGC